MEKKKKKQYCKFTMLPLAMKPKKKISAVPFATLPLTFHDFHL
jgi:hypothetical protein